MMGCLAEEISSNVNVPYSNTFLRVESLQGDLLPRKSAFSSPNHSMPFRQKFYKTHLEILLKMYYFCLANYRYGEEMKRSRHHPATLFIQGSY